MKYGSFETCVLVAASRVPVGSTSCHGRSIPRQIRHTSAGGYWTAPHARHLWRANRPCIALTVSLSEVLLRARGGMIFVDFTYDRPRTAATEHNPRS